MAHTPPARSADGPPAAVLAGIGYWLPPTVLTNEVLGERLGVPADWLSSRTGIDQRHVVTPGTATSDLAVEAARRALDSAGVTEVDTVIVCTSSPDKKLPAVAPGVAARLGLGAVGAFDLSVACSGFLYGLATARGLIAAGTAGRVLVIGAETITSHLDPQDPSTSALFADGAGAAVVRAGVPGAEQGEIGPVVLGSDGGLGDLIQAPGGGSRHPEPGGPGSGTQRYITMSGLPVFNNAVKRMTAASREALAAAGWELADVDRFVIHQANTHILAALGDLLDIPADRMASNIQHVGNTSAASVPILLAQEIAEGRVKPGDRLLLTAFGAGLAWAATTLVCPELPCLP
ncbi:ketoacyl-ACP synthase III [Streptomyces sp. NPDC059894]|uniref:ketoacyl-ACP synthase III n=1 Tax=unclassified Streptomyces TaxID=2593676 RepID=UPI00365BD9C3